MDIRLKKGTQLALQALQELSQNQNREWMGVGQLSRQLKASPSYLAKILGHLSRVGVIDSSTGRTGGYRLTENWKTIPVSVVIASCERLEKFKVCLLDGKNCFGKKEHCRVHPLWLDLNDRFHRLFEKTHLGLIFIKEGNPPLGHS